MRAEFFHLDDLSNNHTTDLGKVCVTLCGLSYTGPGLLPSKHKWVHYALSLQGKGTEFISEVGGVES